MIPQAASKYEFMLGLLEDYTGCTVVPSNTTKNVPAHPYISYSIIHTDVKKGTYAEGMDDNGQAVLFKELLQKWSFTVQAKDDAEAMEKAMLINDFFAEAKRLDLEDNDIIIAEIGAITPRDTFLTVEYEYRKGLDVVLRFNNIIVKDVKDTVESVVLTNDTVGAIELVKE